jgi:tetratricopeptide (TPR) repeat protein
MEHAFSVLAGEEHDADLAILAVQLARALFFSGRVEQAMERNELALEIAEALELPEVLSHGLNTKSLVMQLARGRREEARVLIHAALDVALAHDRPEAAVRAYHNMISYALSASRSREAQALAVELEQLSRKIGKRDSIVRALAWQAGIASGHGEWERALELAEQVANEEGPERDKRLIVATFGTLFALRGELDEARRRLEIMKDLVDPNELQDVAGCQAQEAQLLLAEGKPKEALAAAEAAIAHREELGLTHFPVQDGLECALSAAFVLGQKAKVDELLAIIEQTPPGHLTPFLRGHGARFGASRTARDGERATAHAGFGAAAAIFREIEMPFELAVVLLEHAEWLAEEGRVEEAEPLAAEAREIFERLRATPYIARLDRLPVGVTA